MVVSDPQLFHTAKKLAIACVIAGGISTVGAFALKSKRLPGPYSRGRLVGMQTAAIAAAVLLLGSLAAMAWATWA